MKNLQEAVFNDELSLVFQHEEELASLTNGVFSMGFLMDLTVANEGKGNVVIDAYLFKLPEVITGGEA
ncbi:hypothetical protein ACQKM1_09440 [Peribacillus frigoritolerans]|uniref:hypothetical protein n=1 Tax=Peribacillus frigoritolerans TaxID=450367 RepID=UPI003D01480B